MLVGRADGMVDGVSVNVLTDWPPRRAAPNVANTDRFCATSLFDMRGRRQWQCSGSAPATESGINKEGEGLSVGEGRGNLFRPPVVRSFCRSSTAADFLSNWS